jgi:hypothetical protein
MGTADRRERAELYRAPRCRPLSTTVSYLPRTQRMYIRIRGFGPGGQMPHIASPSRAPVDGHRDSANSGDVRGCVHRDYQDIPVPVTLPSFLC